MFTDDDLTPLRYLDNLLLSEWQNDCFDQHAFSSAHIGKLW